MTTSDDRFIGLYDQYYRPVHAYCRRRTSADHVDDVVADTFLVAWRRIDQVPEGTEALPWLFGVAYRVLSNQWRSKARRSRLQRKLKAVEVEQISPPQEVIVERYESRRVVEALGSLSPKDREILRLAAWEELPQADIAVALDISIDAVRQRLHRAKKNLAKSYERLGKRKSPAAEKGGTW